MSAPARVLLVDDDRNLLRLLAESLTAAGLDVVTAPSGVEGLRRLFEARPAILVLDVMMPGMDGWATLHRVRELCDVPVIMLTARDAEADRLRGFDLGVDDYVVKPFSLKELGARIRAVLARAARAPRPDTRPPVTVGDLVIDFASGLVLKRGAAVALTPTEFRLLAALAEQPGRTVDHRQLLERGWGPAYGHETGHVKRTVWHLRRKLEDDPSKPRLVETVRGFGYRLHRG